jgi:hypothetical protein
VRPTFPLAKEPLHSAGEVMLRAHPETIRRDDAREDTLVRRRERVTGRAIVAVFFETALKNRFVVEKIYERDLVAGLEDGGEIRREWPPFTIARPVSQQRPTFPLAKEPLHSAGEVMLRAHPETILKNRFVVEKIYERDLVAGLEDGGEIRREWPPFRGNNTSSLLILRTLPFPKRRPFPANLTPILQSRNQVPSDDGMCIFERYLSSLA